MKPLSEISKKEISEVKMIVFDVEYPVELAEEINTTISTTQPQPRENKTEKFMRKHLEKLNKIILL